MFYSPGDYETLNGFIYSVTGKIPGEGEVIYYDNLEIKILKASPQTVEEVLIKIRPIKKEKSKLN
ncbi:transporter associated domain-containing protein [Thermodesulfobacterium commune]|uniref:transporter associated domain-containing protein n=1 Tax=Thermodesulfobacterium commune TaxID=1741 RepID=UPI0009DD53F1